MDFINYGNKHRTAFVAPKVVMAESTKEVLEEEKVEIKEEDTPAQIVEKVNKTKKAVAKTKHKGKTVEIKQSLNG